MKTSHNSTWLNLWNLNHKSDALSRSKLVYKSDFTMKPTVLCPNAPMQYRPLGMSIEFSVLGIWQCFVLMRFMFARTNHTLSSAPEVSSHVLLHFPAFSNPSCWATACAQHHRAAPSSKTLMWLKNQWLWLLDSSGFNYRCSQLQRKITGLGRTCQAQTLPGSQGREQGSQTLPSHLTAVGLFWDLGSFSI